MENYLPLLQSTSLFAGISAGELRPLLSELGACIRSYGRGEALVQAGAPSRRVGVVLTGSIEAYRPVPGGRLPFFRSAHPRPGGRGPRPPPAPRPRPTRGCPPPPP